MSQQRHSSIADSPWLWAVVFSAAALVALAIIWPQYLKRQRRLEMQYGAQQEIARRRVTGEAPARPRGAEGDSPPPAVGELIIPIWPVAVVSAAALVLSSIMLVRERRSIRHDLANAQPEQGRGGQS